VSNDVSISEMIHLRRAKIDETRSHVSDPGTSCLVAVGGVSRVIRFGDQFQIRLVGVNASEWARPRCNLSMIARDGEQVERRAPRRGVPNGVCQCFGCEGETCLNDTMGRATPDVPPVWRCRPELNRSAFAWSDRIIRALVLRCVIAGELRQCAGQ
jgi:hypothetical protein